MLQNFEVIKLAYERKTAYLRKIEVFCFPNLYKILAKYAKLCQQKFSIFLKNVFLEQHKYIVVVKQSENLDCTKN